MDASAPRLECDLVMKGGITSGVVYPQLVSKLAEVYDFRCIGGTSAGAIAAGAAAAAQLGVTSGANPNAFAGLEALPKMLGGTAEGASGSMLLNLFQPQPKFRRHFALLTAALNAPVPLRIVKVIINAAWRFPIGALLGAALGLIVLWLSSGFAAWIGGFFALVGLVVGAIAAAVLSFVKYLPGNDFGMCNGMPSGGSKAQALLPWLHEYINALAGKKSGEPLTFGELWAGELREPGKKWPPHDKAERRIELAMITTALNISRPYRFPFESRDLYFAEDEIRKLFPHQVAQWLVDNARPSDTAKRLCATGRRFHALPEARDMPMVLGIRMSLSFPILLSAVPLYSIDRTRSFNAAAATTPVRVLFSDGGICSNFPMHFFDGALPSRPTFGVNLRDFHPEKKDKKKDRVLMPEPAHNNRDVKHHIPEMNTAPGVRSVVGFLGRIVNTMQNWRDQLQIGMPGYRDRIVHVCLDKSEGGINLNMPATTIDTLASAGAEAAEDLRRVFCPNGDSSGTGWYVHRRTRMRTLLAGIDLKLRGLNTALGGAFAPTWSEVVLDKEHAAYPFSSQAHRDLAIDTLNELAKLGKKIEDSGIDLATGAPRPESEWRATPRV